MSFSRPNAALLSANILIQLEEKNTKAAKIFVDEMLDRLSSDEVVKELSRLLTKVKDPAPLLQCIDPGRRSILSATAVRHHIYRVADFLDEKSHTSTMNSLKFAETLVTMLRAHCEGADIQYFIDSRRSQVNNILEEAEQVIKLSYQTRNKKEKISPEIERVFALGVNPMLVLAKGFMSDETPMTEALREDDIQTVDVLYKHIDLCSPKELAVIYIKLYQFKFEATSYLYLDLITDLFSRKQALILPLLSEYDLSNVLLNILHLPKAKPLLLQLVPAYVERASIRGQIDLLSRCLPNHVDLARIILDKSKDSIKTFCAKKENQGLLDYVTKEFIVHKHIDCAMQLIEMGANPMSYSEASVLLRNQSYAVKVIDKLGDKMKGQALACAWEIAHESGFKDVIDLISKKTKDDPLKKIEIYTHLFQARAKEIYFSQEIQTLYLSSQFFSERAEHKLGYSANSILTYVMEKIPNAELITTILKQDFDYLNLHNQLCAVQFLLAEEKAESRAIKLENLLNKLSVCWSSWSPPREIIEELFKAEMNEEHMKTWNTIEANKYVQLLQSYRHAFILSMNQKAMLHKAIVKLIQLTSHDKNACEDLLLQIVKNSNIPEVLVVCDILETDVILKNPKSRVKINQAAVSQILNIAKSANHLYLTDDDHDKVESFLTKQSKARTSFFCKPDYCSEFKSYCWKNNESIISHYSPSQYGW